MIQRWFRSRSVKFYFNTLWLARLFGVLAFIGLVCWIIGLEFGMGLGLGVAWKYLSPRTVFDDVQAQEQARSQQVNLIENLAASNQPDELARQIAILRRMDDARDWRPQRYSLKATRASARAGQGESRPRGES